MCHEVNFFINSDIGSAGVGRMVYTSEWARGILSRLQSMWETVKKRFIFITIRKNQGDSKTSKKRLRCRLQHSLGIVWRPPPPPLTAPSSNQSGQPCRQGPSSQAVQSEGAKAEAGPPHRGGRPGGGGCGGGGGAGRDRRGGVARRLSSSGQVARPWGPAGRGAARCSCPTRRTGAALAGGTALVGAQPWGPEAASSAVLSRAGPSESRRRGPTEAPGPGRRAPCSARSPGRPAPLRQVLRGWLATGTRARGALTRRRRLCYLEIVSVF